ncbi:MAG: cysteine peptidase family C39 domain-containing protein, partial [Methylococcales bacterium]
MANNINRRWLAAEVVQTSAMDCGPAALKCLLAGYGITASYGRLREACQTDVDGTSIDTIEVVANQLGVLAEQVMIPLDHIMLSRADVLPALVVVRHADGANHFVVIWRRVGAWLQIMDPASGRRWLRYKRFLRDIYHHELQVSALAWHSWAQSDEFMQPLRQRLANIGGSTAEITNLCAWALSTQHWSALAMLDAVVRLVSALLAADGLRPGSKAFKLVRTLLTESLKTPDQPFKYISPCYWSVLPSNDSADDQQLLLKGAVLLQIKGRSSTIAPASEPQSLSFELQAALHEKPQHALASLWQMLKADGMFMPVVLAAALMISVAAVFLETVLFRGIFDVATELNLPEQRLGAVIGLMVFVSLLLLLEIPIVLEALRLGRHLEVRLRMALLRKLPQLSDRYFQSRPISDMAERSHSIHLTRLLPSLGIQFLQGCWDLLLTLLGICLLDAANAPLAITIALLALGLPLLVQPFINERDLRVRSHAGALFSFYLDALLGLVAIRTHGAEPAVSREHEGLLVEWAGSTRGLISLSMFSEALQSFVCTSLVGFMLFQHFLRSGAVTGGDLLLVYWALKLPTIGHKLTGLAHQYPSQRNALLRLLEPLAAPDEHSADQEQTPSNLKNNSAIGISITQGSVVAAGHTLLKQLDVRINPGEHIAVVGASGAGKSSLLGLLLGWHRLAAGQLLINGLPLSAGDQQVLRSQTAWVDPAIQIWNDSLLNNLNY